MIDNKVRRLPVIDDRKLVGIISQADIATNIDEEKVGDLVQAISAAPASRARLYERASIAFSDGNNRG